VGAEVVTMTELDPEFISAIARVHNESPASWSGDLHLHIPGKSGELFFSLGVLPALREALPQANIIFHTLRHYFPVILGTVIRPDGATFYDDETEWGLVDEMPLLLKGQVATSKTGYVGFLTGGGNTLHVNLYRTHPFYTIDPLTSASDAPFYRCFMDAVGLSTAVYCPPQWTSEPQLVKRINAKRADERPIALVLSVANAHATGWREMPLTSLGWAELAKQCEQQGLQPVMTAHKDDPRIEAPGWLWYESSDLLEVMTLLSLCQRVAGMNSGLVFSATQIAPGEVTMFDPRQEPLYDFGGMVGDLVIDPLRHVQVPVTDDSDAFALLQRALSWSV